MWNYRWTTAEDGTDPFPSFRRLFITTRNVTAAIGLLVLGLAGNDARADPQVTFESYNYPGKFIRHAGGNGFVTELKKPVDFEDAKFIVRRPALNGDPGAVSLESVNYPGNYLRHQNYRVKLGKPDGSEVFPQDASFYMWKGLADENAVSFEAVNFKGFFIRHQNWELWIVKNDGTELYPDTFVMDATFWQQQLGAGAETPPVQGGGGGGGGVGGGGGTAKAVKVVKDVDVFKNDCDNGPTGVVLRTDTPGVTLVENKDPCFQVKWPAGQGWVYSGEGWVSLELQ
jgi:hypothetical protein